MKKESQQEEKKSYNVSEERINQLSSRLRMMPLTGDQHDIIKNGLIWLISEEETKKE